jgi:hypothetical protein
MKTDGLEGGPAVHVFLNEILYRKATLTTVKYLADARTTKIPSPYLDSVEEHRES